ncbi:maltokinase N-terminal cap-like domain-containing protein [Streptomyces albipurpureus]|uniref:1,4-alpha-glucan branching protein n=1 Tax=Streptomyces albipurpureus TaxID=2897419 RepID=A0ABT0UPF3_9ACTN|nr:1,4-alpha-glucan branching protein [Streptomyces sp. CWNU-1]MCM2390502.1 1,4-alpha-glucan branching protein [Streptomyces sp. CWNU-1]
MAVIHHTDLKPTKLELLANWLPSRPWYRGETGVPELAKAGGFRLDDPQGEVGIEFIVVTDTSGPDQTAYLVPLTYRGAPLEGAENALVGTMEHGVLGPRWAYDGCHDPVLPTQLLALIEGRALAQDQNISDRPDREIICHHTGEGPNSMDFTTPVVDNRESTELSAPLGRTLRVQRVLRPVQGGPPLLAPEATGGVTGSWIMPDGSRARGLFAVLHTSSPT